MTPRPPHKTFRSRIARNIVDNTPASGWKRATAHEKSRLGIRSSEPFYIRKNTRVRKGSVFITRDEFTVKAFGLNRRQLAKTRATPEGETHPRYGYKRPLTEKMRALINKHRRLKLVREARRVYELRGTAIAAGVETSRGVSGEPTKNWPGGRPRAVWSDFKEHLDQAIGPDTAAAVKSRELGGGQTRIANGNWHAMIDELKDTEGENSAIVKLLRSSGRFVKGGVWVTDTAPRT